MNSTTVRTSYPSDVTEEQWRELAVVIPPELDRGRHRSTDVRDVVNGINYRWRTGCVWRMLPHDFPPWATIYTYFRRWQRDGTLRQIRDVLLRRRQRGADSPCAETGRTSPHPRNGRDDHHRRDTAWHTATPQRLDRSR